MPLGNSAFKRLSHEQSSFLGPNANLFPQLSPRSRNPFARLPHLK
jgi:hypothetical protein